MINEVKKYVGKRGLIVTGGLVVFVKIKDYKKVWGKERFLVTPVMGSGEVWVEKIELVTK